MTWIPVSERQPEKINELGSRAVLALDSGFRHIAYLEPGDSWFSDDGVELHDVTHWRDVYLPELPEGE